MFNSEDQLEKAKLLYNQDRFDQAISLINEILTENSRHTRALTWMACCYLSQQKIEKAKEISEMAIQCGPQSFFAHYTGARICCHEEKYKEAKKRLLIAMELDPENTHGLYYLALCEMRMGNYHESKKIIDQGLHLDPNDEDFFVLRAEFNEWDGKSGAALRDTKASLKENPNAAGTMVYRANLLMSENRPIEAEGLVADALRINPNSEYAKSTMIEIKSRKYMVYQGWFKHGFDQRSYTEESGFENFMWTSFAGVIYIGSVVLPLIVLLNWYTRTLFESTLRLKMANAALLNERRILRSKIFVWFHVGLAIGIVTMSLGFTMFPIPQIFMLFIIYLFPTMVWLEIKNERTKKRMRIAMMIFPLAIVLGLITIDPHIATIVYSFVALDVFSFIYTLGLAGDK